MYRFVCPSIRLFVCLSFRHSSKISYGWIEDVEAYKNNIKLQFRDRSIGHHSPQLYPITRPALPSVHPKYRNAYYPPQPRMVPQPTLRATCRDFFKFPKNCEIKKNENSCGRLRRLQKFANILQNEDWLPARRASHLEVTRRDCVHNIVQYTQLKI